MAKLGTVIKLKAIETDIEGIYVRNLPAKVFDASFANLQQDMDEHPEDTIAKLFRELLCDKNSKPFDDVETFEDITSIMSMAAIVDIINAIPKAVAPGANNAGK